MDTMFYQMQSLFEEENDGTTTSKSDYIRLKEEMIHRSKLYYDEDAPEISDAEYEYNIESQYTKSNMCVFVCVSMLNFSVVSDSLQPHRL